MTIDPHKSGFDGHRSTIQDDINRRSVGELGSHLSGETDTETIPGSMDEVKELLLMESGADPSDLERPYLTAIPDTYAGRLTLFEWLDFALGHGGVGRTLEAIEYYENVGWISEDVSSSLRDHVRAFQDKEQTDSATAFGTDDHVVSLVYIARLASMS